MTKSQTAQHSSVLDNTPNLDLLHRQRTFSIDETREQLQQGKAVHKEAVMSGNIDSTVNYSSSSSKKHKQSAPAPAPSSGANFSYATALKSINDTPALPPAPPKEATKKKTKKDDKVKRDKDDSDNQSVQSASATEGKPTTTTNTNTNSPARENKKKKGGEKATAETAESGSAWGGKPSFANVSTYSV